MKLEELSRKFDEDQSEILYRPKISSAAIYESVDDCKSDGIENVYGGNSVDTHENLNGVFTSCGRVSSATCAIYEKVDDCKQEDMSRNLNLSNFESPLVVENNGGHCVNDMNALDSNLHKHNDASEEKVCDSNISRNCEDRLHNGYLEENSGTKGNCSNNEVRIKNVWKFKREHPYAEN